MTRPIPAHGIRACYLRGCRKPECVDANKRYCKAYRVATIRQPVRIDATPVRERIQQWSNAGYSYGQIATTTHCYTGELSKIGSGKQKTIHPDVAARILRARTPLGIPSVAVADSTGTLRRAQALVAFGYPVYRLAAEFDVAANWLGQFLVSPGPTVRLSVALRVSDAYKQLSRIPGGSIYAQTKAARNGWHGPLAWDDIDDPAAKPETGGRGEDGKSRPEAVDIARVRRLTAEGLTAQQIADRIGCHKRTVVRARARSQNQMTTAA